MNICHLYKYENQARLATRKYAEENCDNIRRIVCVNSNLRIWTNDGNVHYFMGEYRYFIWNIGRTYILNGIMMHSGYPIKEINNGE